MMNYDCPNDCEHSMLIINKVYLHTPIVVNGLLLVYEKLYDKMVVAMLILMMLSCSYSIFIDTSLSNYVVIILELGFRLRTSEV